jgi:superfamily II DNA or RNA helicase
VLTPLEAEIVTRFVGPTTFGRGRAYARQGAVRSSQWTNAGTCLFGEVQGGARSPYAVSIIVTRSPSDRIVAIDGACSCPVAINCKHAVALLIAAAPQSVPSDLDPATGAERVVPIVGETRAGGLPAGADRWPGVQPARKAPGWEVPLRAVVGGTESGALESEPAEIGLQFELVMASPPSASRSIEPTPGIRVRPVVRNHTDNWTRAGISWSRLDYFTYGRSVRGRRAKHLMVLTELLALSRLSTGGSYYGATPDAVWLETINSRRLWDLLIEARDLQLPLLGFGRDAVPVDLRARPAQVTIDVTRVDSGLELRPHVLIDDEDVPLASSLLIGESAHGIAWWGDHRSAPGGTARLSLASLAAPVDVGLRAFLRSEPVGVPRRDEGRFLSDFYPKLARRIEVRSSDQSVDLPELPQPTLVLTVKQFDAQRVELRWARGAAGLEWTEPLWAASKGTGDQAAENAIADAVMRVVGSVPELLETTLLGERLAAEVCLEGMSAVMFVSELLPALVGVDGVEIRQDGTPLEYREVLEAPSVRLGGSESSDRDWFDLSVAISVDGEDVPFADLFVALAEGRSHLILPSGTYFSLDRDELGQLAELIAEARTLGDVSGDSIRLSRFQASLWEDLQRLGVVSAQARDWEASVRALSEASSRIEHAVPDGLDATLRPYQLTGFNWLAYLYEHRLGGVLADDMGLGKTIQALALMCHTKEHGLAESPYLVVAPTSVVGNWASECRRFAPELRPVIVTETGTRRGVALRAIAADVDLVITSYALFRIEYDDYAALNWAGLFLDEAQFAKNRTSKAYQRAKMLPAPFKVAMTGTPIENNLMELWSLLSITAPGLFANPDRFTEHYRTPIEKNGDAERLAQLRRRVRPLMLRRTKDQVVRDLPQKQEQILELELNSKHKRLYQTYLQRERQKVLGLLGDMQKNRFEIFRSLTLLRQASLDMSLVDPEHAKVPSTKLDALMEMLDEIVADGNRVLVFSQFTRFLNLARERIVHSGIEYCYLDGKTRKRDDVISGFRTGTAPVFLISLKAGGTGLNLTEADYCIILDPWWNPAIEAQAVDRIHRIGQTKKVMVYRLVAKDTLEEKVMALKAKKGALVASVMDSGDFESGAMTAADIQELLT